MLRKMFPEKNCFKQPAVLITQSDNDSKNKKLLKHVYQPSRIYPNQNITMTFQCGDQFSILVFSKFPKRSWHYWPFVQFLM